MELGILVLPSDPLLESSGEAILVGMWMEIERKGCGRRQKGSQSVTR